MAVQQLLVFNDVALPLPESYNVDLSVIDADTTGTTEAGTTQRDIVRFGIVTISVSFSVNATWLKRLTEYSKMEKLAVEYFDTDTLELKETEMYIDGFKASLYQSTPNKGFWKVSFTLKEF